eukprot:183472-Rhodomonas_salina.3
MQGSNVRVFLVALMICHQSGATFHNFGSRERKLKDDAEALMVSFCYICDQLEAKNRVFAEVDGSATAQFPRLLARYVLVFKAWKVIDEMRIVGGVQYALRALYAAKKCAGSASTALLAEFWVQQARLLFRLLQLLGEPKLREFDASTGRAHLPLPTKEDWECKSTLRGG